MALIDVSLLKCACYTFCCLKKKEKTLIALPECKKATRYEIYRHTAGGAIFTHSNPVHQNKIKPSETLQNHDPVFSIVKNTPCLSKICLFIIFPLHNCSSDGFFSAIWPAAAYFKTHRSSECLQLHRGRAC